MTNIDSSLSDCQGVIATSILVVGSMVGENHHKN